MSGFSADWLGLRETFDAAARSRRLAQRFAAALPAGCTAVDLAGGTGSNIRFLEPLIAVAHRWRLVDSDPALLALARGRTGAECVALDLSGDLAPALDGAGAVTASALIDLVSRAWLDRLVGAACARGMPVLIALSYDGRAAFAPADPRDAAVLDAFNRHQRGDKGFGPALGPECVDAAVAGFERAGYAVETAASDWAIPCDATSMLTATTDGFAGAALEIARADDAVRAWHSQRREQIARGTVSITVGHRDLLALPR